MSGKLTVTLGKKKATTSPLIWQGENHNLKEVGVEANLRDSDFGIRNAFLFDDNKINPSLFRLDSELTVFVLR